MCLNPRDPFTARIFTVDGAFQSLCANSGGGMTRWGVLQPCPLWRSGDSAHPASAAVVSPVHTPFPIRRSPFPRSSRKETSCHA